MKVLFLTIGRMESIEQHSIYPDLLRCFRDHGHQVYTVSTYERRQGKKTECIEEQGVNCLHVRIGNLTKCNMMEKGISTVMLKRQFIKAIKRYFSDIKFDLVLYSTPPVTIAGVVKYIKNRDGASTYLMLKDIFPQNAVDLKLIKKNGLIYKYFRGKEQKLYLISDYIGCTSPANIQFTLRNNPQISADKVEICANCMEPYGDIPNKEKIKLIRKEYKLPIEKKIFLYGGNLGKPQGIEFLMKCLDKTRNLEDAFFLIIGSGTERKKLEQHIEYRKFKNVRLMDHMPKQEFDRLTTACDVGLIFLNYLCSTPNTPSRLLAYTNAAIPVLAVTDPITDVGQMIEEGGFGWHCLSNDIDQYYQIVLQILKTEDMESLRQNSHQYLLDNFTPNKGYESIIKHFGREEKNEFI